ncbi:MAG: phosphoribosylformylglycinamidine synthase subunit PurS, partial [Geodermatophilaceae bacterium]
FELEVTDPVDEAAIRQIADTLLANPVIEDFSVHLQTS